MYIQTVFIALSFALTFLFFLYGFNHYYLLSAAYRYKTPGLPGGTMTDKPRVAIHLPVYNEKYVMHRLILACASIAESYGRDRVKIVIIDDSDDETAEVIDQEIAEYQAKHLEIEVMRRSSRQGYKAGALQAALERTQEEFVAIFDADFTPPPDFLVRSMPFFLQDEQLGIIQSRWTHLNRGYNILTEAIATGIDVHFMIEQTGRYATGSLQNFNGSGGIIRTKALRQAGGWQSDTLSEDLDASYRVQMQGYRVLYLNDLQVPGEIPPTVPSFKKQQARWANGSLRTAKKLLPALLTSRKFGFRQRLEAFIHLTGYMVHPLMFTSFFLTCLAVLLRVDIFHFDKIVTDLEMSGLFGSINAQNTLSIRYVVWTLVGLLILFCTIAAWIPPLIALKQQPISLWRKFYDFVILFFLGCGVSLSNTIEAGKALLTNRDWVFKRTPKYDVRSRKENWSNKSYQVSLDFECFLELIFVCLGGASIGYSFWTSNLGALLILVPFTAAYAFVASLTILQSRQGEGA
ncbi:MAG TPA: glycosyltransferase [Anaerolineales bacterium]|nr:glycosyltransferase [Anaerolineales bacterium]